MAEAPTIGSRGSSKVRTSQSRTFEGLGKKGKKLDPRSLAARKNYLFPFSLSFSLRAHSPLFDLSKNVVAIK